MVQKFKKYFFNLSLSWKLSIFLFGLLFVIAVLTYTYFPMRSFENQLFLANRRLDIIVDINKAVLPNILINKHDEELELALSPIKLNNDIVFFSLAAPDNTVLKSDNIKLVNKYLPRLNIDTNFITSDEKFLIRSSSITKNGKIIANLTVGLSIDYIHYYINNTKNSITIFVVVFLGAGIFMIILFNNLILRQLVLLKVGIRKLAEGDLTQRVEYKYEDELGNLTILFNQMAESLEGKNNALKNEIIQRKTAENELLVTQNFLSDSLQKQKELTELKTRFVSMISHEYRTPLTAIANSSYLIEKYSEKSDYANINKYTKQINNSIERMTNLLEDVLKISKENNLNFQLEFENKNIKDFCNSICEETKLIKNFKHNIITNFEDLNVKIEPKVLHYIINNVLTNAVKYSPADSDIKFDCFTMKDNDTFLYIGIKDSGIGISDEDLKNIFEPFYRGKNIGAIEGTGLGMSIIKDSINLLKGEIMINSKINESTEVKIKIPI